MPGALRGESASFGDQVLQTPDIGTLGTKFNCRLLAEAAARGGYSVGTVEAHYTAGITSSLTRWGVAPADIAAYLANPAVNYATAVGTWQQKIGTQAWLALYARGLQGFTEWRRLDYPILTKTPAIEAYSDIAKRYTYPTSEHTLNPESYKAAAAAIGGDKLTTKLFWDKF